LNLSTKKAMTSNAQSTNPQLSFSGRLTALDAMRGIVVRNGVGPWRMIDNKGFMLKIAPLFWLIAMFLAPKREI
jgi:hypothetical protein